MPKVLAYTITRAATPQRALLLTNTLTDARRSAGHPFHWVVYVNGSPLANNMVEAAIATRVVDEHRSYDTNVGQHIPTNAIVKRAIDENYDLLLRLDDDVEFITKRWLKKMVEAMDALHNKEQSYVISPTIKGLRNRPLLTPPVEVNNVPLQVVQGPLGGICRLTKVTDLVTYPYVSDVRMPMGFGDATSVAKWAVDKGILMVWLKHVKVRHAGTTAKQEEDDKVHFASHAALQHVPYIPPYVAPLGVIE